MKIFMAFAIGIGYIGGGVIAFYVSKMLLNKIIKRFAVNDQQKRLIHISGIVFGVAGFIPAIFLATAVGGNLGGSYGGIISESIGLGEIGIPIGLATGLIVVLTATSLLILLFGAGLGSLVAHTLFHE